jgi:hypothetical protein
MLTSRAFRIGYAVLCALFGVFNLAAAGASGHRTMYIVRGLVFLMIGIGWGINCIPRGTARYLFGSLFGAIRRSGRER